MIYLIENLKMDQNYEHATNDEKLQFYAQIESLMRH